MRHTQMTGRGIFSLFLLVPFVLTIQSVRLSAERVADIPNPRVASGSFVQDSGGVLGLQYIELIDSVCRKLKEANGAELAVVTVRNLGGEEIEPFAEQLFRRFGIGEAGRDNGLLLLFSQDDRAVRIEVGYGLEGVIPDILASTILDEQAVPWFRRGEIGRGLYLTAAELARVATRTSPSPLIIPAPDVWPVQVTAGEEENPAKSRLRLPLLLGGAALFIGLLGIPVTALRISRARALAQKRRLVGKTGWFNFFMFLGTIAAILLLKNRGSDFLSALMPSISVPLSLMGSRVFRRVQRRRLEHYHLSCRGCGNPMTMLGESDDDLRLSIEEKAEEQAGGMDYEVWTCSHCGESEKLAVEMSKAKKCIKCKRRTMRRQEKTLVAATTSHGGVKEITDICVNPNCGYSKTWQIHTSKIYPGGSSSGVGGRSSSSGSSSSRSSFGGGRSGGGGASKRW